MEEEGGNQSTSRNTIHIIGGELSTDELFRFFRDGSLAKFPQVKVGEDSDEQFCVGLLLFHASWNKPPSFSQAAPLLRNMVRPLAQRYNCFVGGIHVDKSTSSEDHCLESKDLPCPPETLPALAVVVINQSQKRESKPQLVYLSTASSTDLLQAWRYPSRFRMDPMLLGEMHQTVASMAGDSLVMLSNNNDLVESTCSIKDDCLRIFVAGDRMSVGKTSICLGILGSLLAKGYVPEDLAYIKPATQNENPQLLQRYCEKVGIQCIPIGPVVYYRGFTRAYLAGLTKTSEEMLQQISEVVDTLADSKKIVVIDGVGFPAVGSICGTDNASVARASGYPSANGGVRIPPGVILVGGSGVGSAVDAFNLNATYFEMANITVLGGIWNKLADDGFYSLENCKEQISSYFNQNTKQINLGRRPFGFLPLFSSLADSSNNDIERVDDFISIFRTQVDLDGIMEAARRQRDNHHEYLDPHVNKRKILNRSIDSSAQKPTSQSLKRRKTVSAARKPASRHEIEQSAIQAGAAPSA
jgi:dethiobiotin synthetase